MKRWIRVLPLLGALGCMAPPSPLRAAAPETLWDIDPAPQPAVVAFSPDGRLLATGRTTIDLWRTYDGRWVRRIRGNPGGAAALAFSPDGRILAVGDGSGTVRLWRTRDGAQLRVLSAPATTVAFSPDGRSLATGSKDGIIRLWTVDSGRLLFSQQVSPPASIPNIAFSPDGATLAAGGTDLLVWRTGDLHPLYRIPLRACSPVRVAFSPDGQLLAAGYESGGRSGRLALYRAADGSLVQTITSYSGLVSLAFSPDGRAVLAGALNPYQEKGLPGELQRWRVADGQLLEAYTPDGGVSSVAFSPNDRWFALGRVDGSVTILANPDAPEPVAGDLDGDGQVTLQDALFALEVAAGLYGSNLDRIRAADIDGDGHITVEDVTAILRRALGLI